VHPRRQNPGYAYARYTKKEEEKTQENTDHRKHTKRNKKHITKNTSHGAYIVHN